MWGMESLEGGEGGEVWVLGEGEGLWAISVRVSGYGGRGVVGFGGRGLEDEWN